MGLRLGKHPLLPPPHFSDTYCNDLIIFHMIYISTIFYDGMLPPPANTDAIHNDYPLGMIIYIILIGLHHYEYDPKLCILGSYVTQTILPGLWL